MAFYTFFQGGDYLIYGSCFNWLATSPGTSSEAALIYVFHANFVTTCQKLADLLYSFAIDFATARAVTVTITAAVTAIATISRSFKVGSWFNITIRALDDVF